MKRIVNFSTTAALLALTLVSCSKSNEKVIQQENIDNKGNVLLVANGEDFVRQGFLAKDGWQIEFDRLDVSVSEVIAYQVDSDLQANLATNLQSQSQVTILDKTQTIDLAAGDSNAAPITVNTKEVPTGLYNALSWEMKPTKDGLLPDQTIILQGKAVKDQRTVNFLIGFNLPLTYYCGEFVGDERKGIVQPRKDAELEMTFHFDHIFGDGESSPDDSINQIALGFQPLADLAPDGNLKLDWQGLQENLAADDYQLLKDAIVGLGHVGEGHCSVNSYQ
ncbi:MAG: DUF4382 domain-containing protein [Cyanobacteria bacterium P01_F01_bin.143]